MVEKKMIKLEIIVKEMNIRKLRITLFIVWIALSLFLLLEKNFLPNLSGKNAPKDPLKLVGSAAYLIRDEYVEEPNAAKTMEGAFRGLIDSLDPLSCYLDKESHAKYMRRQDPALYEPGLILFKSHGRFPVVVAVKEDSPAHRQGIQAGDAVSAIDGRTTLTMSMIEVNLNLKDPSEQPVRLKLIRGSETKVIQVDRVPLVKDAYTFVLQSGLSGILKIHRLYPPCVSRIKKDVVPKLRSAQKPLVLDLRECSEGEIGEAQAFLNMLLNQEKIGHLQTKRGTSVSLSLNGQSELDKIPLIVWTSRATIGPGEIVAGVLREFKAVKIIGLQTPGLVTQQELIPLDDGSSLLLTSSVFQLNRGDSFFEKGLKPDEEIKEDETTSAAYLEKTLKHVSN